MIIKFINKIIFLIKFMFDSELFYKKAEVKTIIKKIFF